MFTTRTTSESQLDRISGGVTMRLKLGVFGLGAIAFCWFGSAALAGTGRSFAVWSRWHSDASRYIQSVIPS